MSSSISWVICRLESSCKEGREMTDIRSSNRSIDRMGSSTVNNAGGAGKSTLKVGQGQNVQAQSGGGCC